METMAYYFGLPSRPALVARTSTTPWVVPTGAYAYPEPKELRVVGNHALNEVWEDNLALKVHALLDSMQVKWTSTDVVRIGIVGESSAPVILWVGVTPTSLSRANGTVVARKCREILEEYDITDVDVEIRESIVARFGRKLLNPMSSDPVSFYDPTNSSDPTVYLRRPLTATLGLSICAKPTPRVEGTGGFFMAEGGDSQRLFLVTARHVVLPESNGNNKFERKGKASGQRRQNVLLLGEVAFVKFLGSIELKIRDKAFLARVRGLYMNKRDNRMANEIYRREAQHLSDKGKEAEESLKTFYQDVFNHWGTLENRILGHVIFSPPISVVEQYTEDFAIIEIDASKINSNNFKGNAINLGKEISSTIFTGMVYPNRQTRDARNFEYPLDRLLKLRGTIPDEEMRHPTTLDQNGKPCLTVIKRGNATGLTVGRANNACSYVREYTFDNNSPKTSKEWAIISLDGASRPFSAEGDSGSVIVDGRGRMGGLLTGGAVGATSTTDILTDITYATPINFLLKRIHSYGFSRAHVL
jgi:hypothetical protein